MIHFLYGENDYAVDQQVAGYRQAFVAKYGEQNVVNIDVNDTAPADIMRQLTAISLFATNQLIIVKAITASAEAWALLGDNVDYIPDTTDVVLTDVKELSKVRNLSATKTFKKLKSAGADIQKFDLVKSYNLNSWLSAEARSLGIDMDAPSQKRLLELTSGDENQQARLATELAKLKLLDRPIGVVDVEQYVEPSLNANAFIVFEMILTTQTQLAVNMLRQLRDAGEDANRFLGLLASQEVALLASATGAKVKLSPYQLRQARELWIKLPGEASDKLKVLHNVADRLAKLDGEIKLSNPDEAWLRLEASLANLIK